jgi:hypothetical protein
VQEQKVKHRTVIDVFIDLIAIFAVHVLCSGNDQRSVAYVLGNGMELTSMPFTTAMAGRL